MNINATLIGQMIAFVFFVVFTMKYVWPPLIAALEERQKRIADGLAAAEKGVQELADAKSQSDVVLKEARDQAQEILNTANRQASDTVDHAKTTARTEGERLLAAAQEEIKAEAGRAREGLRKEVGQLAVAGAQQILKREIDANAHQDILKGLVERI